MIKTFISINEVKKLIKAFQEKYNDLGCEGLPYYPEETEIELYGYTVSGDGAAEKCAKHSDVELKELAKDFKRT